MRNDINIEEYKNRLLEEKGRVEAELKTVGRINPDNPNDWEPIPGEKDDGTSDLNDFADSYEEYEENTAILKELEIEFNDIKDALAKIESGNYGICEVGGEPIEKERLDANPAARTCIKHIRQ